MYESNVCAVMTYDFYHDAMRLDTSSDGVIRMRKKSTMIFGMI